jgi:cysteinyl-tRNA synthetase
MSKSLGNDIRVHDLLDQGYEPAAIRHQLISAQYRSELNFTMAGLAASAQAVQRLLDFRDRLEGAAAAAHAEPTRLPELAEGLLDGFRTAMDGDLNSAEALAALFMFVKEVNAELDRVGDAELDRVGDQVRPDDQAVALDALERVDQVLGLVEVARSGREIDDDTVAWIEERIEARRAAREARDWDQADAIRDELAERGIVLEDGAQGTRWKRLHQGETVG